MLQTRRNFLRGLFAAPAIIRLAPLMRISVLPTEMMLGRFALAEAGEFVSGLGALYGHLWVRPEWVTAIGDCV